jgi:hypothetical protein
MAATFPGIENAQACARATHYDSAECSVTRAFSDGNDTDGLRLITRWWRRSRQFRHATAEIMVCPPADEQSREGKSSALHDR